jgi:hypothetical protein
MAVERTVEFVTEVMQDNYHVTGEGTTGKLRLNPRGELVVPDFFTQLVLDGRVFNASNAVQETAEDLSETARGTNNVNPALLLDIPTGTTAIPLEVILDIAADGTDEDLAITINTDDAVRYSSGGGAITPINMRKDDPRSSNCTVKSGSSTITAAANTDDDTIYSARLPAEALPRTSETGTPSFFWSAKLYTPPVLIGPASLLVFIVGATADATYMWSVKWAEFATTEIT